MAPTRRPSEVTRDEAEKIHKAIKKTKADKRTTIYVEIPENTSPAAMKQISSKLASQSFGRMIFTKPRKFLLEDSTTAAKKAAAVDSQSTK